MKKIYITTTLPYLNGQPHLGHAFEFIRADVCARYWKSQGAEVFFNLGSDEHGLKIYQKAIEKKITPQILIDNNLKFFKKLIVDLNLSEHNFLRTTSPEHKKAVYYLWQTIASRDIYKKSYQGLYCTSEEDFFAKKDLINGKCPNGDTPFFIEEENYFFRFSNYKKNLLNLYNQNSNFIFPKKRLNEMKNILEQIDDFSISRLRAKLPYGLEVPGDSKHTIYVWLDALMSYLATLGYPENNSWNDFDLRIQFCGKDNLKFQAGYFQSMLLALDLKNTDHICIGGHILNQGQKMSKSIGNVIDPLELIKKYGADAVRYYFLRSSSNFEDINFSEEHFKEIYNGELVNGLGNLVRRVFTMIISNKILISKDLKIKTPQHLNHNNFDFNGYMQFIYEKINKLNKIISEKEPYKLIKINKKEAENLLIEIFLELEEIINLLEPIMPNFSQVTFKIIKEIRENKKFQLINYFEYIN